MDKRGCLSIGLFSWIALIFLWSMDAQALGVEGLSCQPQSGHWSLSPEGFRLEGALCTRNGEGYDFYRFDFAQKQASFAAHTSAMDARSLRYLHADTELFLVSDKTRLYAVSRADFRILWLRDWPNIEVHSVDPFDRSLIALLERDEGATRLHVLRIDGAQVQEAFALALQALLELRWQPERLVILEAQRLSWSRRVSTMESLSIGEQRSGVERLTLPQGYPLMNALEAGNYAIDRYGLMSIDARRTRLHYYNYHLNAMSTFSTNATATVRQLAGNPSYAMALTTDQLLVRFVSRFGPYGRCELQEGCWGKLSMRYEAKYWKVHGEPKRPMFLASDKVLVLDGGSDHRAQSIDISDPMRWKRMALMEYRGPGRLASLRDRELFTLHDEGPVVVRRWNPSSGELLARLDAEAFDELPERESFKELQSLEPAEGDLPYYFLRAADGHFVVLDSRNMQISKAYAKEARPAYLRVGDEITAFALASGPASWDIFGQNQGSLSLGELGAVEVQELQSHAVKWYGYCNPEQRCFIFDAPSESEDALMPTPEIATQEHSPSLAAWALAILALSAMLIVTLWRRGFWKRSHIEPINSKAGTLDSVSIELLDSKNRRFVTERDRKYFLNSNLLSNLAFRVVISVVLGLGLSFAVAGPYFFDDGLEVFLSWLAVLGLPIIAVTWISSSWTYWNRLTLLRFGRIVEGSWRNCANPNQSIVYTPESGKSFELSRSQWKRADFVPIIIFDPIAPDFCVQYTGELSFPLATKLDDEERTQSARTYDLGRWGLVCLLLGLCILGTQVLFKLSYPNPMGVWTLDQITAESEQSGKDFIPLCLDRCSQGTQSDSCQRQCQNRQMRIIFERAGLELSKDPTTRPAQVLAEQKAMTLNLRQELAEKNQSCAKLTQALEALPLWPLPWSKAFWLYYGQKAPYLASDIAQLHREILDDLEHFAKLCSSDQHCALDPSQCPEPPQCQGDISELKNKVCAFYLRLARTMPAAPRELDI